MIVSHVSPDWDAIASLWLLKRFGPFQDAEIVLVNTGNPDSAILASADAVVDTGREYDPARWRFDHHQLNGEASTETCATRQVFAHLVGGQPGAFEASEEMARHYLWPLIELIYAGDVAGTWSKDWQSSRQLGLHAQLSARKAARWADERLLSWGFQELDLLALHLKARADAAAILDQYTAYRSDDGLVVALDQAPQAASSAAIEAGARLVVFHSVYPETVAVGCARGGEWQEPRVGDLVYWSLACMAQMDGYDPATMPDALKGPLEVELSSWFCHPAGFFAGRGTPKAPDARPLDVPIKEIAIALDTAWRR